MPSSKDVKSQKKSNVVSSRPTISSSSSQTPMSVGKKRPRRRRKLAPIVSSCITDKIPSVELIDTVSFVKSSTMYDDTNKENQSSHLNEKRVDSSCPNSRNEEGKIRKKRNQKSISNTEYALQNAIDSAYHPITSLKLLHVLAEASAYFPNTLPEGSLLLEEKKVDIINVARKCIRSATSNSDSDSNSQLANLKIATHCLRAITPILTSILYKDIIKEDSVRMVIKLLYHCIISSGELYLETSKETDWMNSVSIGAAMVCFAGYQVLGVLLRNALPREMIMQEQCVERFIFDKFPIHSSTCHISSSHFGSTGEDFTKEKIIKIAVQSCFSVSTVLWKIHCNSLLQGCKSNNYLQEKLESKEELTEYGCHFKTIVLATLMKDDTSSSSFAFRKILCSVSMSWILSLVMNHQTNAKKSESNPAETVQIASVMGYIKRAGKLLIDAASQLENVLSIDIDKAGRNSSDDRGLRHCKTTKSKELLQESLMLRRDYVLLFLLNRQIDNSAWISPPATLIRDHWPLLRRGVVHACSSAWKFAATHAQMVSDGTEATILKEYHQEVGLALDKIAFSQVELNDSYVEYCTYRALHSGNCYTKTTMKELSNCSEKDCIFHHLPFRFCHQRQFCCQQNDSNRAPSTCIALATFFVALANKYSNYELSQGCDIDGARIQIGVLDSAINLFKEKFLKAKCKIDDRSLQLSYNVLSLLKLNTTVFNAANAKKVEKVSSFAEHYKLSIFGRLLGECYAPLNSVMASSLQNGAYRYNILAVEGYSTSAMIFQLLGETSMESLNHGRDSNSALLDYEEVILNCSSKSNEFICKCSEICAVKFNGTEYSMLERVGKSLSYLGNRRIEKKQKTSPLLPLLTSLDAFCRAYARSPKLEYRISARFSQVASFLYSLRMRKEACIALLFSIRYQFHEYLLVERSEEREKDCATDLLLVCDEYLSNKFRSDSSLMGENNIYSSCLPLVKRLIRIYIETVLSTNDMPPISLDRDTLNIIQRLHFGSDFIQLHNSENGFFLSQLVRAVIVPYNQCGPDLKQQIGLVCNILHSLSNVVPNEDDFVSNSDTSLRELDNALEQTCCSLKCQGQFHHEYIAALYIAGAAVRKSITKEELSDEHVASPCLYIEQAEQLLCQSYEAETSCGRRVAILAYHASVLFFKTKILITRDEKCPLNSEQKKAKCVSPLITHYEKVAVICSEAGKLISSNTLNSEIINLPKKVVASLILTFAKVYQKFDMEDASIPAACHIKFLFDLSPGCGTMAGPLLFRGELHISASLLVAEAKTELSLQETTANDVIQNADLLCSRVREGIYVGNEESTFDIDTRKQLIEDLLINACQLQIHARTTELHTTILSMGRLIRIMQQQHAIFAPSGNILDLVDNATQDKANIILWLTMQWWLSSYTLALAEGYDRCGEIMTALHFARHSCILSQNAVKMTRENFLSATSLDDILEGQLSGLPFSNSSTRILPFISRIFYCQGYIGKFYSKVGDHKKAKQYALSLAESLDLLPRGFSTRNLTIADILRVVNSNVTTIRHMKCRRFLIQTLLLGMPPSPIEDYLNDSVDGNFAENFHPSKDSLPSSQAVELNLSPHCLDWLREKIRDLILHGDFSFHSSNAKLFYQAAAHVSQNLRDIPVDLMEGYIAINKSPLCTPSAVHCFNVDSETFGTTFCEVSLRLAQTLKENSSEEDKSMYIKLLENISKSRFASSTCRAEAYYNLGHEFLHLSKERGELYNLWMGNCSIRNRSDISPLKPKLTHTENYSSISSSSSLQAAYCHFLNAASFAGPASSLLSRQILRCLALVSGPEGSDENKSITTGELVHTSIGSSARQAVARASSFTANEIQSKENDALSEDSSNLIFGAFDLPVSSSGVGERERKVKKMYNLGCDLIPHDWNFIAMTICPTGELLISSLQLSRNKPRYRTVCIPTPERSGHQISVNCFDEIIKPFDDLMDRSHKQLRGMDSENAADKFKDKTAKRSWWDERQSIDDELQDLLNLMEERYFGVECVQDIITNNSEVDDTNIWCNDSSEFSVGNLAAKFEAACAVEDGVEPSSLDTESNDVASGKESLQSKTVVKLKEDLMKYGIGGKSIRGLRKAALVDLLWNKIEEEIHQSKSSNGSEGTSVGSSETIKLEEHCQPNDSNSTVNTNRSVTFLILDEHLSRLPLEGIPTFRGKTVCRIPSLPFAIATLHRSKESSNNPIPEINPFGASYVLNPELDLQGTEQRLYPALKNISDSNEWDWEGVVGAFPSEEFMEAALKRKDGLFMYCGHGGGERFYPRSRVMNLISNKASTGDCGLHLARKCRSSIILMGCSSGRLTSVNSSNGRSDYRDRVHYEPEGAALSYLCAGAPCVIGNLWDVTDRDIDRFFLHLMDEFLGTPGKESSPPLDNKIGGLNLAECVAGSRMACKMRYIVGCAPVVYGVPASVVRSQCRRYVPHEGIK